MKSKICLIVDNPKRDLDGLILLGWELMKTGCEVIFVPMYEWHEIFFIKPHFVLLNYSRPENSKLINRLQSLKIKTGVLDTEGGILANPEKTFKNASRFAKKVDLYFMWGYKQYEAILKSGLESLKIKVTGCPRYDFGSEPWNTSFSKNNTKNKKTILINANFSLNNSKYKDPKKELAALVKAKGWSKEEANEWFHQNLITNQRFNEVIIKLINDFPEILFIIRPHPFENEKQYFDLIKGKNNARVEVGGTVFKMIAQSNLVIHQNCSTAVEATLLNVIPVNLKWISEPLLREHVPEQVSLNVMSYDILHELVKKVNLGKKIDFPVSSKKDRNQVIYDWFYLTDGKASSRVAFEISNLLKNYKHQKGKTFKYFIEMYLQTLKYRDYKKFLFQLIFNFTGYKGLKYLKYIFKKITGRKNNYDKYFDLNYVEDFCKKLNSIDQNSYHVEYYKNSYASIELKEYIK